MKSAYINGNVYTGQLPVRQAFLVEQGVFRKVGSNGEVLREISGEDRVVDLRGHFVCPGFNDSHMHLLSFGNFLRTLRLAEHSGSLSDMLRYVRSCLEEHPPRAGRWLLGRGWNQDFFSDVSRMPDRYDLDGISTEVPIMLTRACGHCCVVNTKALEISRIDGNTLSPEGGDVGMRDGRPDGRFYDNAMELVQRCLPPPGREEIRDMLRNACREVNRYGITSVQSDDYLVFQGVSWETVQDVLEEMARTGELTVRVYEQAQFTDMKGLEDFLGKGNCTGKGGNMFRIGPVKLLGDGSLGSRTAYLSRPYADSDADTRGFPLYSDREMQAMVTCAHSHGMQLAVHAIGDACLDQILNAMEQAMQAFPRPDPRHGIVHCQITRPDQLRRIRDLGLHVYAQSIFLDYDNHIVEKRAGKELAGTSYHWKTLMDMGVSVSNGSDCPVELPHVMAGVECAVTRTSMDGTGPYLPGEAFSVREALDSYTLRGAEASFEETVKGQIAPGFLADFTVLSENPFDTDPRRLHEISVLLCCLGGKEVYDAHLF